MADNPIFDPSGTVRMIPDAQVQDALAAGGKRALKMLDPKGTPRWIPAESLPDAIKAGGKLLQTQVEAPPFNPKVPAPPAISANEQAQGFAGAMYGKMGEFAKNLPLMTPPGQAYSDIKNFIAQLRGQAPKTHTPLQSTAGTLGIDTQAVKNAAEGGHVDIPSLAAETMFPIAQNLAMARLGGKATAQSLAEQGKPAAVNKLAYASDVSSGKMNFPEVIKKALPDLAEGANRLPAKSEGVQRLLDVVNGQDAALEGDFKRILKPNEQRVVSGKPIADAIRNEITPAMQKTRPEAVKALNKEASRWEQDFTLGELQAERQRLNAQLDPFYSKTELQQAVLDAKERASLLADKVAVESIRHDVLYPELQKATGIDMTPLKQRQATLATMREQLVPKVNQAANEVAIGKGSPFYSRAHVGTYASPRGGHAYIGGIADMLSAPEVRRAAAVKRAVSKVLEQRPGNVGAATAAGIANEAQQGED